MRSSKMNLKYFGKCAALLAVSTLVSLPPSGLAQQTNFEKATKLYSQKQFQSAYALFSSIYTADPSNLTALFYCGNCQMAAGQRSEAIKAYSEIVTRSPNSAVGIAAQSALNSVNASTTAAQLAKTTGPVGRMDADKIPQVAAAYRASIGEPKSIATSMKGDIKAQEIDEIVKTVRAQADRPNVSDSFVMETKEALTQYPTPLLHLLIKKGIHVKLTPTMVDNDPSLAYKQPRGYEDGKTYKNCPGLFNGYDIVVCEYEFIGDSNELRKCLGPMGTLRHELGHAVDRALGLVSRTEEFRHRYLLDIGTIDDETKSKITYYLQKDKAGPSETFAEIMCSKYGGRPAGDSRKPEEVAKAFKGTTAYVNKLIASLSAN